MRQCVHFLYFVFIPLFFSCNNNGGNSSCLHPDCQEAKLDCNCCPLDDSNTAPNSSIASVKVFIEASGSMSGLMPPGSTTSFQKVVPDILSKIERSYPTRLFTIKERSPEPITQEEAATRIMRGDFNWGNNTSVPVMLDTINNYQDENSVTLLISDLIYSPKEDKEVSQAVTRISEQIGAKNISTTLIVMYSDFSAKAKFAKSPYYILLQGKDENVDAIKAQIIQSLALFNQNYDELSFGRRMSNPRYSILPYTNVTNGLAVKCNGENGRYLVFKDVNENDTSTFWLGVNLPLLKYMDNISYIKRNISLFTKGVKATIRDVVKNEDLEKLLEDEEEKKIAKNYSYFLKLSTYELTDLTGFINFDLKNERPDWIDSLNHDNQNQADNIRDKTYGLNNIYLAMQDAYKTSENSEITKTFTITLLKK